MKKKAFNFKRFCLIVAIIICALFLSFLTFFAIMFSKYNLDVNKLTSVNNGIRVYSSSGVDNTLYNSNRSIVEIDSLPDHVLKAFISVEDKRFYDHNGYDVKRIAKSVLVNFSTKSKSQGASTISQQLIKNALLTNEKTYSRKLEELVLSIKMEKEFKKDEILEMYLNTIYFGSNAYGLENASKTYFNKSAKDLTVNEACCLAGLIKSPKQFSPKENYNNAIKRKNMVANLMFKQKYIDKEQLDQVLSSQIELNLSKDDNSYEKEAIFEACKILNMSERDLINANYQIVTHKDDSLQEQVINKNNEIILNSTEQKIGLDSLSVVVNNQGKVLSYYANSNYNLHNLTRQPASTLKPLAVYLPCFKHNILSPASQILDEEINYSGFSPKNADNKYHGHISVRDALKNSLNVPAVKALDYLGVKKAKNELTNLGINISNADLNLNLALGSTKNGIKVLDLLQAYTVLMNLGEMRPLTFIDRILDANGNVVYSFEEFSQNVTDDAGCFLVNDILKDCAKSGTAKRLESLNLPIASKTGTHSTNKGNTDLYNIAYTSEHAALTWIADIDKIYLPNNLLSSSQPTDINKAIFESLYVDKKPKDFAVPNNVIKASYDLNEYNTNHVLVSPSRDIERYMSFDYFKNDNLPSPYIANDLNLCVEFSPLGALISFNAVASKTYYLKRKTISGTESLTTISGHNGEYVYSDSMAYNFDNIEYCIEENDIPLSSVTVRPKNYLINHLTNQMLISKKKWWV